MTAYLKIVDKYPADYTFFRFGGLSNGLPSPAAGCLQLVPKTNVGLESFYASFQFKMGQRDLICLWESHQTMSIN